jgi:hypothetical protein
MPLVEAWRNVASTPEKKMHRSLSSWQQPLLQPPQPCPQGAVQLLEHSGAGAQQA